MKALIIDSSTVFHEILDDIFISASVSAHHTETAEQALIELNNEHYDFVCLSKYLDDTNGVKLTKEIREMDAYSHVPILMFTSDETSRNYVEALAAGVTEVFHKKDVLELNHFLRHYMRQKQRLSGRVLYVEDTELHQKLVTEMLSTYGLQVDVFASGEHAWAAYGTEEYDLVITDIILSGTMTGLSLVNRIRRLAGEKGDVPILAVTGYDDVARRIELFSYGINDYVTKPIYEEELLSRVRNLLESRAFYNELAKQTKTAEAAVEARSRFIATMNHEFRTPLNSIIGFSEIALMDIESGHLDKLKTYFESIQTAGRHLNLLIQDTMDMSMIENRMIRFQLEAVNIKSACQVAVEQLSKEATKLNVTLNLLDANEEIAVNCDRMRLHQVLINLLSNAIKYNTDNGSVQMYYKRTQNKKLKLFVKDTGIGIGDNEQATIFEPYRRVLEKNHVEGIGLGLPIVKQLVEGMGGGVGVKSEKAKGSIFWVELPIV